MSRNLTERSCHYKIISRLAEEDLLKAVLKVLELLQFRFKVELAVNDINQLIDPTLDMQFVDIIRGKVFVSGFLGVLRYLDL